MQQNSGFRKSIEKPLYSYALLATGLLYFLCFASYRLDLPGLYQDEVLFVPSVLQLLGYQLTLYDYPASIGSWPFMIFPYIGALKTYLYSPIFWLFGITPWSIRLPIVLLAALGLVFTFDFFKSRWGVIPAAIVFLLMATDPFFIFHSRLDWGPHMIAMFLKMLSFGLCFTWLESGKLPYFVWMLGLLLLGLWDKLNFLWVIAALFGALAVCYPARSFISLRRHQWQTCITLTAFSIILFCMILVFVLPSIHSNFKNRNLDIIQHTFRIFSSYNLSFNAQSLFQRLFEDKIDSKIIFSLKYIILFPQLIFGIIVASISLYKKKNWDSPEMLLAFTSTVMILLFLQLCITKEAGGSHHLIVLWPFQHIHLVLCGILIHRWSQSPSVWVKKLFLRCSFPVFAGLLLFLIALQHIKATATYAFSLRPQGHYKNLYDPAIYHLHDVLSHIAAESILSVDWGLHLPLLALAAAETKSAYIDGAIFVRAPEVDLQSTQWFYESFLAGKKLVFLYYDKPRKPEQVENFKKYLQYWRLQPTEQRILPAADGQPWVVMVWIDTSKR